VPEIYGLSGAIRNLFPVRSPRLPDRFSGKLWSFDQYPLSIRGASQCTNAEPRSRLTSIEIMLSISERRFLGSLLIE
jgi:hypothetical protein